MQSATMFSGIVSEPFTTAQPAWSPSVSRADLAESRASVELEGALPEWLKGQLLRTAPAVFELGQWRAEHWFDGLGMLYSFELNAPGVRFTQRLIESRVSAEAREGRVRTASFGSKNQRSFWQRLFEPIPRVTDNANVNVVRVGGEWIAMTESPHQLAIDPATLAVSGRVAYDDEFPSSMSMTAHPHFDFERGEVVNLGVSFGRDAQVIAFGHTPDTRTRKEIARFGVPELPYLHSFGLTREKLVIIGHPLRAKPVSLLWSNRGFIDHFSWKPEQGTELFVLDRKSPGAKPRVFATEACFVYHTVNTYHDGTDLVLDVLAYPDPSVTSQFRVENMLSELSFTRPKLCRVRMHASGHTTLETLCDIGFEFPAIHYRKVSGQPQRFVWGATAKGDGEDIVQVDCRSGATRRWGMTGYRFGEPVFVPRPGSAAEDDGVLLTTGSANDRSVLAVLDARSLEPRALAHLPLPIPLGFHGSFGA